mmetsp:Transcript_51549/g.144013  ORF Transcript_51549/g.144013 Transcript_51549/m.144013 type:complete len:251 (+) Transcript_51549:417-1169(+)
MGRVAAASGPQRTPGRALNCVKNWRGGSWNCVRNVASASRLPTRPRPPRSEPRGRLRGRWSRIPASAFRYRRDKQKKTKDAEGTSASTFAAKADADVEAGRLVFEPRTVELPFHASVGRRGAKVQKLRSALREEEAGLRKLKQAEEAGRGDEMRKELAMQKALMRAKGEKVHDDISKLRKTQKMMDKKKARGKETWAARVDENKKLAEDKQSQRKENLAQKRDGKKKNKGKIDGRSGFEGKHSGYLNQAR